MKTAAFGAQGGRNGHVVPMNRSEQSRFGIVDAAVIAGLLLVTLGVLGLVLHFALN